jgi:hypothetical protein
VAHTQTDMFTLHATNISAADTDVNPTKASGTAPLLRDRAARCDRAMRGAVLPLNQRGLFQRDSAVIARCPAAAAPNTAQLPTCRQRALLRLQRVSHASFSDAAVAVGCHRDRQRVGSGGYIFLPQKAPIVHSGPIRPTIQLTTP